MAHNIAQGKQNRLEFRPPLGRAAKKKFQIHSEVLIETALILFFMTLGMNVIARLLVWSVARRTPQEVRN